MPYRHPRFRRVTTVVPVSLTERDRKIIRFIYEHRFLRSSHVIALVGGSRQQVLRRLKLLYHHGYLERPRCQIDTYYKGGSRQIIYGLGNKAGLVLKRELGLAFRELSWGEKNRAIGRVFLEHSILVSDAMIAIELACRKTQIRLVTDRELTSLGEQQNFRWKVNLSNRMKLGVIPDRVFALEFSNADGKTERAYFFLEADRGTMPVMRRNLLQTSFYKKLLAYEATWSQSIHRIHFGFHRFRVLTITTGVARVNSLIEACSRLERGRGLFLFAGRSILDEPDNLFSPIWKTAGQSEAVSLLN